MKKYHIVWKDVGSFFREVTARETDSPDEPDQKRHQNCRTKRQSCNRVSEKVEEVMDAMHAVTSNDWKISTGYYSLYFSLYSVLTEIGFKSENHTARSC